MNIDGINVAPEGTHHVRVGERLYPDTYDEVLSFHTPGLAAVRRGAEAWHIDTTGSPAYPRRFLRTFGFYEGRAAVTSPDGWHHILPSGEDVYPERHSWCGNYQEGLCTARGAEGRYYHVDLSGQPAYAPRWRYAGDYRQDIAVVQADDGRSTHVGRDGRPSHGQWFLDLDVFHKGYARARDGDGWTHVDRAGRPAYARRFAAVEPFYNGQARVERQDGALEVIDEAGKTVAELRPPLRSEFASLSGDLVGFWRTQTISTAVELGVFEALPATADDMARRCGLAGDRGRRLLRALAEVGLVQNEGGTWRLTTRGSYLTLDHPLTLADAAVEYARRFGKVWAALPAALRVSSGWCPPDVFADVARDPGGVLGHHRMLRSYARHDYACVAQALGLRGDEIVVDAGGGLGVLSQLLLQAFPSLHVVLLDRPEVAALAEVPRELEGRLTPLAADLFAPWGVQADAVVLARVLHDWDDDAAGRVLRNARAALPKGGKVFAVEMVLSAEGAAGGLCDLHLLVATGGQERTAEDYARLMTEAGFDFQGVVGLPSLPSIVMGVAR